MKTNVLNDLSNVVKKGTGLACSWSQVGRMSEGGAIEHPLSTHSAPFGIRWKPAGEKGSTRVWKHVAMIFAVLMMSIANIGMAWGTSGVITAASTTDLGKGNTPRYVVEQAGVGRLMKNATGSSAWSVSDGKLTTGSNKFALQTYNAISSIIIYGNGTGNGRTFSSMRVGTTTSNYASAAATGSGTMSSGGATDQTITITPSSTIAANSYVEITFSGNVNIYSVELVYAGASGKNIYLKPNGIWNPGEGERFAAYYWKSANTSDNGWVDFASYNSCTPVYKAVIPAGYDKTILCRMDGSKAANNWDNKWNQTLDLTVPTGNDTLYTISSINGCTDGKSCGSWGTYSAPTFTISFQGNGNTGGSTSSHTGIACNGSQTLRANGFTRTGWTFTGWNTSPYGDGTAYAAGATISSITSDITLYAQWEKVMYMKSSMSWWYDASAWFAVWVANADESKQAWVAMTKAENCSDPEVYKATVPGNGYTKVVFVRKNPANMTLATWDNKWNQSSKESMPTSNNQFTITGGSDDNCTGSWGTYSAPTLTISYNNGGGSGSMSSQTSIACGTDKATTANTFTRSGYIFTGWHADVDVTVGGANKTAGTLLADGVTIQDISSNITLTAQWEEVVTLYTVTYNVNSGGSVTPTSATQASSGASLTLPTPTWSGYTFDGWYNAGTKIGNGGASYTPTADITLYAHWTDNISGKVFSFIDNNYGDKFKAFDLSDWVTGNATGKSKTYTNGDGVQYSVSAGCWDSKSNAISSLAKFKGGTSTMSVVIPTGKIATVKISYNAYGTGDDYRLTVNSTAQANPSTKLTDGMTNAQVISSMKEITLSSQTGTLTLGISNTSKNNYIGRVSAVITGYVVTYAKGSAGGASGDSFTGTKTAGSSFTLSSSSSAFTREGYGYDGWSVNADGSTKDYNLGGSYTTDAPITLYPHWVAACSATQPGTIGKGTLSACTLRLTAGGSPAANNTWYWQSSADGTDKSESGATKDVTSTGTYYIRSYCTTGSGCWSEAQSVTVSASDLTPAAPTGLSAGSISVTGVTFTITDAANASSYDIYYSTSSTAPTLGTGATTTSTSKTKAVTDLTAGTTYYAWVRSVCGSYKSGWTALGNGGTFTTSTVTVTHTLTNVTKTSGAETAGGSDYTAVYSANTDYSMPTPSVTINGNPATSGTDYTWTAGTGTITIPLNKITGNIVITLNSAATAPTNVAISGAYHYYPGETISLTATATGGNGPKTYQWYHGGTADGNAIDGATSATFTKSNCVVGDAGSYYCKVTCGGSASTWSDGAGHDPYNVKIMQFVLKNASGVTQSTTPLTKVDATHATVILHLTGGTTYKFRITDGCGNYFGNTGTMTNGNSTDWYMNADADCGMTTGLKTSNYTFNVTLGDLGNGMQVTAIYPGGDQAAGKIIYWDNSVLNWADGAQWYRIGKSTHHNKIQMTKVSGTANLYKVTTIEYNGFEYWHIANNQGNGDGNLFWTKGDAAKAITNAMEFEGAPVTLDAITVTPTNSHETGETSDNDNCQFYTHTTVSGMKRDRVTITAPVNGTITVNYTSEEGVASSFSATTVDMYQDLAHTVILTSITAVANTGYDAGAITINGGAYSANYVVTGATTIAASFTPHTYSITYKDQGDAAFSGTHVDSPNAHPTTHTYATATTLNSATKTGYTFGGWFTNSACTGEAVASLGATAFSADITLYAKWTVNNYNLTWNLGGGTTTSAGTGIASGVSSNTTSSVAYGTSLTAPTVTKTGYNFSAWSPSVASTMPAEATTYTATWTAATYAVTLNTNGGTINAGNVTSYTYGTGATLPTNVTKDGYIFDGWFDNSSLTGSAVTSISSSATGNKEFWAKWTLDSGCKTWAGTPSSWTDNKMTIGSTLELESVSAAINTSSNNEVWSGHTETVIALAGSGQYVQGHFTDGSNINTVTVSAANNQSAGKDYEYVIIFCANSSFSSGVTGQTHAAPSHEDAQNDAKLVHEFTAPAGTKYFRIYRKVDAIGGYAGGGAGKTTRVYRIEVCPVLCTTPDAPTSPTNGATTSTTQAVSWTDAGNDQWEVYVSTSSSTPAANVTPTASPTTASYTFEGLTASTTYYWWVRSVCDASHKSSWVAGTSFTTSAAEPDPLVHWTMKINNSAWGTTATATTDGTNITSINTSRSGTATGTATSATVKVTMASAEVSDNSAPDNSANFTFTVNSAKKVVPEKVTCQVFNVSSGNRTYKAQISDNNGHVYNSTNTLAVSTEATLTDATFNFASGGVLVGDVTLKVYAWKTSGSPTEFRMGQHVKFYGEVAATADYTVTHTLSNVTKSAGATSVKEGNNYTATYAGAGGYTLPSTITVTIGGSPATAGTDYTWTQGTGVVSIPGNKVTGNIVITVTGVAVVHHDVTFSLTNVVYSSGDNQGTDAATEGVAFSTVFAASSGYDLPSTITVTIGGSPATVSTDYTWNSSTGAFEVPAAKVTGDIVVTIVGPEHVTSECITITNFETSQHSNSSNKPDSQGKYIYGYKTTVDAEHAVTITTSNTNNKGQNSNADMLVQYGTSIYIYADNTTTGGTPATFSNVTSVSLKIKNKHATDKSNFTIKVGSTTIANAVSLTDANNSTYTTYTYSNLAQLSGKIEIHNGGSGSTNFNFFVDDIEICTADMSACTTPVIPSLSNQALCEGANAAAWDATQTAVLADGETVSYQWQLKNGSNWDDISGATSASYDVSDAVTEAMAGTYRVVVTVSKAGYSSSSATREVTLSVTEATEVTGITADKATVYPGNSVTLTATANTSVTWEWYTCTNAEGAGESSISGATSASYTIASAGAVGTYYYKVKATSSCGTASAVYTLTVSPAASSEDCFHFVSVIPTSSDIAVSSNSDIVTPTHATTLEGGTMKVGSQQVNITKNYGLKLESSKSVSITLNNALAAGNVVIVKGTSGTAGYGVTINGVNFYNADNKTFDVSYTVVADDGLEGKTALTVTKYSGSSYLQEIQITGCGVACSDPEVTASVDNSTICVGGSVTFTAANAHASATYQWQKYSGSAWTNISGEESATYTINPVAAGDETKYRVIASHDCNRTSNEITLNVAAAPVFGDVPSSVSVMQTIALSINTVEATDAVKYRWYKSADPTWDAGDVEIGTNKELIKAYDSEAIGSPSYYIFCRAQNACDITTSSAIAVNVTAYVEEDCATKGNEGEAQFEFENTSCSQGTYSNESAWDTNSRTKYLTYTAPEGKYFDEAKVKVAVSSGSKCGYAYSTDGGVNWTYAEKNGLSSTLAEVTIDLTGNVNAFRIGRNLQDGSSKDWGVTSGTFYLTKACFTYIDACTSTTVTPSTSSVNYEMGGAWSNPTFTLGPAAVSGETLTYSSSNEDIASVDDDGTITFNGDAGIVTITAAYAGGEVSSTQYCASEGSYTINVSCTGGAPKVVPDGSTDMSGCNSSVTLHAKKQDGTAFADGTYQWFRNGEEIDGATSSSYTTTQAGTYTVERTNAGGCTSPSTNNAIVTSETTEPEVERLVPFQYYHVDKIYTAQMKMRHLFAVKNSGKLDGKSFKLYVSRNGGAATDVTSSNALAIWTNADGRVDTVMIDLNKLSGKYSEDDELVFTCKAVDCQGNVSDVYKNTITMNVIGATPTLALICSGSSKAGGTRKTGELTVGGDFLTGYNKADLCEQTGNTSFNADAEWGLYTRLKANYIVTPVNGYAVFNKLNYEPFDILLLTDYPKASKSDAAATVLDDMADLVDFRPMLSLKAHMVSKTPSKWAEKGFTTAPVHVTGGDGRIYMNIVCYAHPMFDGIKEAGDHIFRDNDDNSQIVYEVLTGPGHENSKGLQGFEIDAAENFVTIGLIHYNATATENSPSTGVLSWAPGSKDRMLVAAVERQTNLEARLIVLAVNCGAQSKFTETGRTIVHKCLEYLLSDATDPITPVADCSFTFDNGAGALHEAEWYQDQENCPGCTGTLGDGLWSTEANWGPDRVSIPGEFTSVRIAAPVTVDMEHAHAMEARIVEGGRITIPAGMGLDVKSTIRRMDDNEISPTEVVDLSIGSTLSGNGTLIFNNNAGDTKAGVAMCSKGFIDYTDPSKPKGIKNYQYIGVPCVNINAAYNYYGSWIYSWSDKGSGYGWVKVANGGIVTTWTGYCITQESAGTYYAISGTLAATGTVDIPVPAGENMVVGNSWTAPISIGAFADDDFENLLGNVYFFNAGVDKDYTSGHTETADKYAPSTYVTVPIHAADYTGTSDHIPSLQGFFVKNTSGSDGVLHLDYDRHVRGTTRDNILSGPMHAPRRANAQSDEPAVLKIKVSGENYDDKLLLLAREDFSMGFDNGWDGDKWDGNESALYIYTKDEAGTENSVSAIPEMEGTVIGFRAGEDDAYTLHFEYLNSAEELYLFDTETNAYTKIMTGATYRFFTEDKEKHERFIITRKSPQIATDVDEVDSGKRREVRKLLIEDKMYILVNGMLYDATGKVVK